MEGRFGGLELEMAHRGGWHIDEDPLTIDLEITDIAADNPANSRSSRQRSCLSTNGVFSSRTSVYSSMKAFHPVSAGGEAAKTSRTCDEAKLFNGNPETM